MILRKPYAFFIKHFRLLHFILFLFLAFTVYKANLVRVFFNEYLNEIAYIIPKNTSTELFSSFTYVFGVIVIISSIIIFLVMNRKSKPALLYALNILVMFAVLVLMIYSQSIVYQLETQLITVTILRALRDIWNVFFIVQCVFAVIMFVRATGFDMKKFDFRQDLMELNISSDDNEEFEVQFKFDKNLWGRKLKKNFRELKYFIIENKKIILLLSTIVIAVMVFILYNNIWKYNKHYEKDSYFLTQEFAMKIGDSYITNKNYKGDVITSNSLVVVEFTAKKSLGETINIGKTVLKIGSSIYYPITSKYDEDLNDLGNTYNNQKLNNDINEYLLVYEIPTTKVNEKMTFSYYNSTEKTLFGNKNFEFTVNLNPINLNSQIEKVDSQFEKTMELRNQSIDASLTVTNYEIKDIFESTYRKCITKIECLDFKQYIQPAFTGYQDKTILKLNTVLNYKEGSIIKDNLSKLIEKYGEIKYTINDVSYITKDISETNFSVQKDEDNFYLEVPKNIEYATNIEFVIKIRNYEYVYSLK